MDERSHSAPASDRGDDFRQAPEVYANLIEEKLREGDLVAAAGVKGLMLDLKPIDTRRLYLKTPNNAQGDPADWARCPYVTSNPERKATREALRKYLGEEPIDEHVDEEYNRMVVDRVGTAVVRGAEGDSIGEVTVYTPDNQELYQLRSHLPSTFGVAWGRARPETLQTLTEAGYQVVHAESPPTVTA